MEKCAYSQELLEKMPRKEAMQLVANLGGINGDSVTKKIQLLNFRKQRLL